MKKTLRQQAIGLCVAAAATTTALAEDAPSAPVHGVNCQTAGVSATTSAAGYTIRIVQIDDVKAGRTLFRAGSGTGVPTYMLDAGQYRMTMRITEHLGLAYEGYAPQRLRTIEFPLAAGTILDFTLHETEDGKRWFLKPASVEISKFDPARLPEGVQRPDGLACELPSVSGR